MSPASKGNNWLTVLQKRAQILAQIRDFFTSRKVLEVDTPHLSPTGNPDPYIESFSCDNLYLNTSPEFYMKRLLSAGCGDIYQLAHVFRKNEQGRYHAPEFMLLEWYRLGFSLFELMDEVVDLVRLFIPQLAVQTLSYRELFVIYADIADISNEAVVRKVADQHDISVPAGLSLDDLLNLVLSMIIEPKLKNTDLLFVYDYPPSQASLAKIKPNGMAARFELYINGIEIANGFDELNDASEQKRRFMANNQTRKIKGQEEVVIDDKMLAALASGLPQCCGVALGVDRLIMLALGQERIADVKSL